MQPSGFVDKNIVHPRRLSLIAVIILSLLIASAADYLLVFWLTIPQVPSAFVGIYRRVGPESGSQVFCAGSSLTVSAFSWSEVSQGFGQGIETWGVGGSSPDIWEEWQKQRPLSNVTIIGVSVYDLNENHIADARANVVPFARTTEDLWESQAGSDISHRILGQYPLKYARVFFPTAGNTDRVLVGLRVKASQLLGKEATLAQHEGIMFEPPPPILDAGQSTSSIAEWSSDHLIRRLAVLRAENRGRHEFLRGPKNCALHRLLSQAHRQGRVILVVLPVSKPYTQEFLDKNSDAAFEEAIRQAVAIVPDAALVRLDHLPGILDPANFFDLVHLNSRGRRLATQAFLADMSRSGSSQTRAASFGPTSSSPAQYEQ